MPRQQQKKWKNNFGENSIIAGGKNEILIDRLKFNTNDKYMYDAWAIAIFSALCWWWQLQFHDLLSFLLLLLGGMEKYTEEKTGSVHNRVCAWKMYQKMLHNSFIKVFIFDSCSRISDCSCNNRNRTEGKQKDRDRMRHWKRWTFFYVLTFSSICITKWTVAVLCVSIQQSAHICVIVTRRSVKSENWSLEWRKERRTKLMEVERR